MIIQEPVQAAIWHCLNHYDYQNAVFLAERLCAEVETEDSIFILATCYFRSNMIHEAYWLLHTKSPRSPQCRYLLAKCAYQLKKLVEAESALSNSNFSDIKNFDEISKEFGEVACFALQLIAKICSQTERYKIAAEAYKKALKLNPFLWEAFAELCNYGEKIDPNLIFQFPNNTDIFSTCQGNNINSIILTGINNTILMNGGGIGIGVGGTGGNVVGGVGTGNGGGNNSGLIGIGGAIIPDLYTLMMNYNNNAYLNSTNNINSNNGDSNHNNSNIYILSTPPFTGGDNNLHPREQQLQQQQQQLITPNNNNNLNNNINNNNNLNSSNTTIMANSNGIGIQNMNNTSSTMNFTSPFISAGNNLTDDTPVSANSNPTAYWDSLNSNNPNAANADVGTPFTRRPFKYLSSMSPGTPSFGILPISPCDTPISGLGQTGFTTGRLIGTPVSTAISNNMNNNNINNTGGSSPSTMLMEVNQEQKSIGKKLKNHVGSIINRKETPPLQISSKPAVFTQTGNITPRTPNNLQGQNGPRRSSRLFSNSNYSVKENSKSPNINKFAQSRSPPRKTKKGMSKIVLNNDLNEGKQQQQQTPQQLHHNQQKEKAEKIETVTTDSTAGGDLISGDNKVLLNNSLNNAQTMAHQILLLRKQSAEGLMVLLRGIGQSYLHLAQYNCKDAISSFNSIPSHHLKTGWVQSMIALAHYELREYEAAAAIFKEIHEEEPNRLHLMEIYSTTLWHLQREVALSALAQDLMAQDKNSPITWCVAGNCFSLHKEHETAIKFFKRAVQVDPDFVYSYTLLGHELVITEELDKAMSYFRTATLKDPRHYNAWFGIGTIYSKQERYELAELHYKKALKINPKNSVIMVHIGAMQFFRQKTEQALQTLNAAISIDPKNPLCKFHRGSMYYSMGKHQEALRELEELKQIVPKESVVFYLIGKIHKNLGNIDLALMHFSWATDLDPKGANNQLKDETNLVSRTTVATGGGGTVVAPAGSNIPGMNVSGDGGTAVAGNEINIETDAEPTSDRSDDSTQAQLDADPNYDSDSY